MLAEQSRLTDELYAQMLELMHYPQGHSFDGLKCQPHHNYWQLENIGLVSLDCQEHKWQKVAKLTTRGQLLVGQAQLHRLRRRRRMR